MSPRTKVKVKYARWIQLLFRLLALIGAVGMLFCVICIKETQGTEGWIIRIPVKLSPCTVNEQNLIISSLALPFCTPYMQSIILPDLQSVARQLLPPAT